MTPNNAPKNLNQNVKVCLDKIFNQFQVRRTCANSNIEWRPPIWGQYVGHMITLNQSKSRILFLGSILTNERSNHGLAIFRQNIHAGFSTSVQLVKLHPDKGFRGGILRSEVEKGEVKCENDKKGIGSLLPQGGIGNSNAQCWVASLPVNQLRK